MKYEGKPLHQPLTPGSKVKIKTGSLKGSVKTVGRVIRRPGIKDCLVQLKDSLGTGITKKLYPRRIHQSNLEIQFRRYKPPGKDSGS